MNKTLKFALVSGWILFSRGYDVYATSQFTPDLSKEANPLVSVLGMSWTPLMLVVGGLTLYTVFAYFVATFRKFDLKPSEKGMSFLQFIPFLYLGKKSHWTGIFYKFPRDLKRLHHYMGHFLAPALAFAGVISTLMWLGINYTDFYREMHSTYLIYSIIVAGTLVIGWAWHRKLYREYKLATENE